MKVILLVAGRGVRLLPYTSGVPKPLVPVGNRPLLGHILEAFSGIHVDELILITGHLSSQIERYVADVYTRPFRIIEQTNLDGTGGAVHAARVHIDCPVLVVFGDALFDIGLSRSTEMPSGNIIWTQTVDDFQNYGIVHGDTAGRMKEIIEKPKSDVGRQANIGIYFVSDYQLLLECLGEVMAGPSIKGEYFFTYALNGMVKHGANIAIREAAAWHDCGRLHALLAAQGAHFSRHIPPAKQHRPGVTIIEPTIIDADVELEDCVIGPNVSIGAGCRIKSSRVHHTIIGRNCALHQVTLEQVLLGDGTHMSGQNYKGFIAGHGQVRQAD
jgi:glucose-1-phosphate thymidylyltransferase